MKFIINKKEELQIPSTKLYNLGSVVTSINDLLNDSIIYMDLNTVPVLFIDGFKYLINDYNPSDYREDFERLITESDLISFGGSGTASTLQEVTNEGNFTTTAIAAEGGFAKQNGLTNAEFGTAYSGGSGKFSFNTNGDGTEFSANTSLSINANIEEYVSIQTIDNDQEITTTLTVKPIGFGVYQTNGVTNTNISFDLNNGFGISSSNDNFAYLKSENITGGLRTFQFPNIDGEIALSSVVQRSTASSGTVNILSGITDHFFIHESAGASASLTINLPSAPLNNQKITIMSVDGIVALTLVPLVGAIIGSVTALPALGVAKFIYHAPLSKWYKIS